MLDQIPTEILSRIAYHLSLPTLSPPVSLLQSCSTIHEALVPGNNPRLYAKLFRSAFDTKAAKRRSLDDVPGSNATVGDGKGKGKDRKKGKGRGRAKSKGEDVTLAIGLTAELERRVRAIESLKRRVRRNDVRGMGVEEGWVVYLMMIENDGKNIRHLQFLPDLLDLFHAQILHPWSFTRGYPPESTLSSLMLWVDWIYSHHPRPPLTAITSSYSTTTSYQPSLTPAEIQLASERERQRAYERDYPHEAQSMKRTALRPYVFAAHKYSVYFAPWMATHVPLRRTGIVLNEGVSVGGHEGGFGMDDEEGGMWEMRERARAENYAGFKALDRGAEVEWYGQTIRLSPPILAHAALLKFFDGRRGRYSDDSDDSDDDHDDEDDVSGDEDNEEGAGEEAEEEDEPMRSADAPVSRSDQSKTKHKPKVHPITLSTSHDRDFRRLIACADPQTSPGLPRGSWRGVFAGAWEGTFSFFEFDAYGEMLAGNAGAIYAGPYGVQRQVWKLHETFVRRKLPPRDEEDERTAASVRELDEGSEVDMELDDEGQEAALSSEEDEDEEAFPLHGPATNAGFPLGPSTLRGGLASARAEETALQETINQQVAAMGDEYEVIPEDELEDMEARAEEVGLEMILTGTGHSAWGRFLLKGRVRYWDGLATCVKEYAPDSRGKWLYRGYVVSGGSMVGRWRDTYTADQFVGYEGAYILNRR